MPWGAAGELGYWDAWEDWRKAQESTRQRKLDGFLLLWNLSLLYNVRSVAFTSKCRRKKRISWENFLCMYIPPGSQVRTLGEDLGFLHLLHSDLIE